MRASRRSSAQWLGCRRSLPDVSNWKGREGRGREAWTNEAAEERPPSDRGSRPNHRGQKALAQARNVAADLVPPPSRKAPRQADGPAANFFQIGTSYAGSDDRAFGNRTQKDSPIAVYGFRVVDVRQARIDEVPYKGIRVSMKVLMPNGFNKPPSRRRVAESEGPNCPIWLEAREVRRWYFGP
jgi:hypothetical protein